MVAPALLAPLIVGAGLAAKGIQGHVQEERKRRLLTETIPQMIQSINQQQATSQTPAVTGAQQPTEVPQLEAPTPEQTPVPGGEEGSPIKPGDVSELPVLPSRNLVQAAPFTLQGYTVDESGNVNFQIKKDQGQLGAQWFGEFQRSRQRIQQTSPGITPLELDSQAVADTIRRTGMLMPQQLQQQLNPDTREKVFEQVYWGAFYRTVNSPDIKRALTLLARQDGVEMTPQALDAAVTHYAMRAVANDMGGYVPEDVREHLFRLEGPPINDETMTEVYRLFNVANPNQVTDAMLTQAQQSLKEKRIDENYETTKAQEFGKESAAQTIFEQETGTGRTGPIGRETTEAKIKAREAPIEPKVRAQLGIPKNLETYLDVVEANKRLLTPQDQKNIETIRQVQLVVQQLKNLGKEIFTSKSDYANRIEHGLKLKWEVATGTSLGEAVQQYRAKTDTMVRLLLKLVGETGGRFTDKDMQQIKNAVPEIEGLIGDAVQIMPESSNVAVGKFTDLDQLLLSTLTFIKSPQMVTTTPPQQGGGKFKITKDGKLEKK